MTRRPARSWPASTSTAGSTPSPRRPLCSPCSVGSSRWPRAPSGSGVATMSPRMVPPASWSRTPVPPRGAVRASMVLTRCGAAGSA
ncbi:hypothetical protein ACFFX0_19340 [Citricoccus parietis]|uniref:Uncharacterized protein n=1 Tax=Citricoccus parietis TaxID=592307 RepID=A0ABV5G2S0_9MICC